MLKPEITKAYNSYYDMSFSDLNKSIKSAIEADNKDKEFAYSLAIMAKLTKLMYLGGEDFRKKGVKTVFCEIAVNFYDSIFLIRACPALVGVDIVLSLEGKDGKTIKEYVDIGDFLGSLNEESISIIFSDLDKFEKKLLSSKV